MSNLQPYAFPAGTRCPQASDLIDAAIEHGFALWRECSLDERWFEKAALSDERVSPRMHFPKLSAQHVGYRGELSTRDVDHVITGAQPLPIHTDGLLSGAQVDIIILYCKRAGPCHGGQTIIVDQELAMSSMARKLAIPIESDSLEYRILDHDYFHDRPGEWHTIPSFRDFGRVRSLNLALPFVGRFTVSRPSWEVRLMNTDEDHTLGYFNRLSSHFLQPSHCYSHQWRTGDLLVLDNQRTLHGRLPFGSGDVRELWRLQFRLT